MNIRLALIDAIKCFAARRQSPRVVEKITYVFMLVPFDFRGNGHAKKTEVRGDRINNGSYTGNAQTNDVFSALDALGRGGSRTTAERDLNNAPELNHDLMWTWFLPNPLWQPNKSNCTITNPFSYGLNGFNTNKTRRDS